MVDPVCEGDSWKSMKHAWDLSTASSARPYKSRELLVLLRVARNPIWH